MAEKYTCVMGRYLFNTLGSSARPFGAHHPQTSVTARSEGKARKKCRRAFVNQTYFESRTGHCIIARGNQGQFFFTTSGAHHGTPKMIGRRICRDRVKRTYVSVT